MLTRLTMVPGMYVVRGSTRFRCYYFSSLGDASCYWDYMKDRVIIPSSENANSLQKESSKMSQGAIQA